MYIAWFGTGVKAKFEGLEVSIPKIFKNVLTPLYGDYMIPSPVEKRIAHHYADIIDPFKQYTP